MKFFKNNKNILIIIIILFSVISYLIIENINENSNNIIYNETNNTNEEEINVNIDPNANIIEENHIEEEKEKIYIYITGEVNNTGVIILEKGSRIIDAINAAGGTTNKANLSKVNLVYLLSDGMKINIPNDEDLKNNFNFEYITIDSGDERQEINENVDLMDMKNSNIININTATQTEFETLPGIGPSIALNIVNYRKENGKFSSIEDIKNVNGIGESKFEKIEKYITI